MKNYGLFNNLSSGLIAGVIIGFVSACGTTMDVVEKSLEEGDLVPEQAAATADFLNEYDHHLPEPRNQLLDIDIAFERSNVMATGDTVHVQIGIATRNPSIDATQLHVLVYNPGTISADNQTKLQVTTLAAQSLANELPGGSSLTIDVVNRFSGLDDQTKSLITHKGDPTLVQFLRGYARVPLSAGKHHFMLLLAEQDGFSGIEKRDLIDLANIFSVKSTTLSVVSVGDSPYVAFLKALSEKGQGRFAVQTERFDMKAWLRDELHYANALKLRDIKLSIRSQHGATIKTVKSPIGYYASNNIVDKTISELNQGQDYVVLAELDIPSVTSSANDELIHVAVDYFDPAKKQYYTVRKTGRIHYVMDRNQTLNHDNDKVVRSLLIMGTQSVIQNIVPVIKDKRYYHAVAMLTEQKIKLNDFGQKYEDQELIRDALLLSKYAEHLYNYDEKMFQTVKIWHDLSWDTRRYTEN
jgi:hypothetical protein